MKRIAVLFAIVCLCHITVFGQKKYEMVIEKTDGTEIVVNTEDIVRTYFRERTEEEKPDDNNGGNQSDDESLNGLTASNLIGVWQIIESNDGAGRINHRVGGTWSFNSDGTWESSYSTTYSNWSISEDGYLLLTRKNNGLIEKYSAEIKDGKLYTLYDREYKVFEKVNLSNKVNITSDYFVGTWEADGGSAYGKWIFNSNGTCNFSHTSGKKNYSTDGTWTYTPSTRMLVTTVTNWKWEVTSVTDNKWTAGDGKSYKRVK